MSWLVGVAAAVLIQGANPSGGEAETLLEKVPRAAITVAVVDHRRLSSHPAYADVLRLLYHRRLARGIAALGEAGIATGAQLGTTVGFVLSGGRSGEILPLSPDGLERARAHLERVHKRPPEQGGEGDKRWVRWDSKYTLGLLGAGRGVFGPHALVLKVQGLSAGGARTVKKRPHYRRLVRSASRGGASAWGLSWHKTAGPDQPTHGYLRVAGTGDLDLECVAYTRDEASAKALAAKAQGVVDRKLVQPPMMRALGISWLAQRLELSPTGKRVEARIRLMTAQVQLLAQMGPQVLLALGVP